MEINYMIAVVFISFVLLTMVLMCVADKMDARKAEKLRIQKEKERYAKYLRHWIDDDYCPITEEEIPKLVEEYFANKYSKKK